MLLAAVTAARSVLRELKRTGSIADVAKRVISFTELFDLVGMREVQELEERYGVADDARARY